MKARVPMGQPIRAAVLELDIKSGIEVLRVEDLVSHPFFLLYEFFNCFSPRYRKVCHLHLVGRSLCNAGAWQHL